MLKPYKTFDFKCAIKGQISNKKLPFLELQASHLAFPWKSNIPGLSAFGTAHTDRNCLEFRELCMEVFLFFC